WADASAGGGPPPGWSNQKIRVFNNTFATLHGLRSIQDIRLSRMSNLVSSVEVFNNIFAHAGSGYAVEFTTSSRTNILTKLDGNIYYITVTLIANWNVMRTPSGSGWKLSNVKNAGWEVNGIHGDPGFVSVSNHHTTNQNI